MRKTDNPNNIYVTNKVLTPEQKQDIWNKFIGIITGYNDPTAANKDFEAYINKNYAKTFPSGAITGVLDFLNSPESLNYINSQPGITRNARLSYAKTKVSDTETKYSFIPRQGAPRETSNYVSPIKPGVMNPRGNVVDNIVGALKGTRYTGRTTKRPTTKTDEEMLLERRKLEEDYATRRTEWEKQADATPILFGSGGDLPIGGILQTLGGAALIATGVGVPAGVGMLAGGLTDIASGTLLKEKKTTPPETEPSWSDQTRYNQMNSRPLSESPMLATGGRVTLPGGGLIPQASNAATAVGNSHEQGGIQLPGAEIEDNETLVQSPYTGETQVHSDRLGYADETNQLANIKGQLEYELQNRVSYMQAVGSELDKLNTKVETERDKFKRNSIKREISVIGKNFAKAKMDADAISAQIQQIDAAIEQQFQQQEQQAAAMGLRDNQKQVMPWGGTMGPITEEEWLAQTTIKNANASNITPLPSKTAIQIPINNPGIPSRPTYNDYGKPKSNFDYGQLAETLIPFASNIYNTFANKQLDNVDVPQSRRLSTPTLNADVNVNPQIEGINAAIRATNEYITGNVSDATTRRASVASANIAGARAKGEIYGQRTNAEQAIRNQNLQIAATIDESNMRNDYINQVTQQQADIAKIERRSANVANATDKVIQNLSQKNALTFQEKQLAINALNYEGTSIPIEVDLILGKFKSEDDLISNMKRYGMDINSAKAKELIGRFNSRKRK
ncbi:hypothetical protein DSECCO2_120000 [anaerobic digester metagenome]